MSWFDLRGRVLLFAAAGGYSTAGKKLKSTSGWNWISYYNISGNGTDDFGFSALPGGYRRPDGTFGNAGDSGLWWTATEYSDGYAYDRGIDCDLDHVISIYYEAEGFVLKRI